MTPTNGNKFKRRYFGYITFTDDNQVCTIVHKNGSIIAHLILDDLTLVDAAQKAHFRRPPEWEERKATGKAWNEIDPTVEPAYLEVLPLDSKEIEKTAFPSEKELSIKEYEF